MMAIPEHNFSVDCGINEDAVAKVLPGLYFLIFIPALVLNVTVMWVLMRLKTESTFMVYLKNQMTADLLLTLVLPVKAASELPGATEGLQKFSCRFASVIFYHCLYVSIILMGLISLDRFFSIVWPDVCGTGRGCPGQSLFFGWISSAVAWVGILIGVTLPTIILTNREPSDDAKELCIAMKDPIGMAFHDGVVWAMNFVFWVVLILIVFCYACIARKVVRSYKTSGSTNTKRKRRTKANVFIVLAVFLVCFAPYHVVRCPYTLVQKKDESCKRIVLKLAKDFTLWLSATNVCLDPLIYFFLCRSFREKLSDLGIFRRISNSFSGTNEVTRTTNE